MIKITRNELCPCGSGRKYKKCCLLDTEKNSRLERVSKRVSTMKEFITLLNKRLCVYTFKVTLDRYPKKVWRKIEATEDQTLYDFHMIIQNAFNWDNDHCFSFFMTNKYWAKEQVYSGLPDGDFNPPLNFFVKTDERPASEAELMDLDLCVNQQFKYIFDYGDEIRHAIEVVKMVEKSNTTSGYIKIVEYFGEAPSQYD